MDGGSVLVISDTPALARLVVDALGAHGVACVELRDRSGGREALATGAILIVPASRSVRLGGATVELTSVEYSILERLARNAGHVVSRDELMRQACGREASPLDRSLDVHVSHLRRKLRHGGARIVTVRGAGYMLAL
jgi:two-component system response regulator CpxR